MQNNLLASVYAKSLVGIAQEQNKLDEVYRDVLYMIDVAKQSREFRNLVSSPVIAADKKWSIINAVVQGKISELTSRFIQLLIKKDREKNLLQILEAFVGQYNEVMGIHEVKLTTAKALTPEARETFMNKLKEETSFEQIQLETVVNPDIIGGFILEYHGNLVDASIQRDLKDIRKQFKTNLYEHNIR